MKIVNVGRVIIKIKLFFFSIFTSSGTFSISPLVVLAPFSSFFGFVLSFLLNENERNERKRFFDFSFFDFFALSVTGVDAAFTSSPVSTASLLSLSVESAASVPSPFSVGFAVSDASFDAASVSAGLASSVAGFSSTASVFSVATSFSFSASSFFSSCKLNKNEKST